MYTPRANDALLELSDLPQSPVGAPCSKIFAGELGGLLSYYPQDTYLKSSLYRRARGEPLEFQCILFLRRLYREGPYAPSWRYGFFSERSGHAQRSRLAAASWWLQQWKRMPEQITLKLFASRARLLMKVIRSPSTLREAR